MISALRGVPTLASQRDEEKQEWHIVEMAQQQYVWTDNGVELLLKITVNIINIINQSI